MPTTTAVTDDTRSASPLTKESIAVAIASRKDFGVLELYGAFAKARNAIPAGGCPWEPAALLAASAVWTAFDRVAGEMSKVDSVPDVCPCCDMRARLDRLIEVAAQAVADERHGRKACPRLLVNCENLADYAGDDDGDATATRSVLELARDVFVAAFAATKPEDRF
jgi:hypothetical protein